MERSREQAETTAAHVNPWLSVAARVRRSSKSCQPEGLKEGLKALDQTTLRFQALQVIANTQRIEVAPDKRSGRSGHLRTSSSAVVGQKHDIGECASRANNDDYEYA
jgi:hypothetical protein